MVWRKIQESFNFGQNVMQTKGADAGFNLWCQNFKSWKAAELLIFQGRNPSMTPWNQCFEPFIRTTSVSTQVHNCAKGESTKILHRRHEGRASEYSFIGTPLSERSMWTFPHHIRYVWGVKKNSGLTDILIGRVAQNIISLKSIHAQAAYWEPKGLSSSFHCMIIIKWQLAEVGIVQAQQQVNGLKRFYQLYPFAQVSSLLHFGIVFENLPNCFEA